MTIPKIIHQTWKDENVPAQFKRFANTWKENHPDWEYILWTDEMNRAFIKNSFADFIEKYDGYPANIQRVDAVRYFILYKMGGLFVDLDFECLKNIEPLLEKESVWGMEPLEHCRMHNKDLIISNAFMACTKGNSFLGKLCDELYNYQGRKAAKPFDNILETTGPFMLTRVYQGYPDKDHVKLLDYNLIYPLTKNEISLPADRWSNEMKLKIDEAYAVHYYWGTWWKPINIEETE